MGFVSWLRDKINPIIEEPEESFAEQEARAEAKLGDIYADSMAKDVGDAFDALSEDLDMDEKAEDEIVDDIVAAIDVGDVDATSLLDDEDMEDFSEIDVGDLESENVDIFTSDDHLIHAIIDDGDEDEFSVEIINTDMLDDDFEVLPRDAESPPLDDTMDLSGLKVAELKELCRERDLPVSGKKADLIARLS